MKVGELIELLWDVPPDADIDRLSFNCWPSMLDYTFITDTYRKAGTLRSDPNYDPYEGEVAFAQRLYYDRVGPYEGR